MCARRAYEVLMKNKSLRLLPPGSITPDGWLKKQFLLVNALQKRIGAERELFDAGKWRGGETLPRYVRGLIMLADALDDALLKDKAAGFITSILDSAEPGGDFGVHSSGGSAAKIEALKAVLSYYESTGDDNALSFMRRFFKNQFNTLSVTPLWYRSRARLGEELPALSAVCAGEDPAWLGDLARKLTSLSCDWLRFANKFPFKRPFDKMVSARALEKALHTVRSAETAKRRKPLTAAKADAEWRKITHRLMCEADGVTVAKAVKYPAVYAMLAGDDSLAVHSLRMLGALERYHGNATGMFSSDPWLAGTSPSRGIDVESAAELEESLLTVMQATGEAACADLMELIAFNVLPAAALDDLSAVRDVLSPNSADTSALPVNAGGMYPNGGLFTKGASRGALALLSAYPFFLRSVCLAHEDGLDFFSYAPCTVRATVGGAKLVIKLDTGYPFRNTIVFKVEDADGDVPLRLNFRVPRRTSMQLISGGQTVASGERSLSVKCILRTGSTFMLKLNIPLTVNGNRDGSVSFYKGSLLMAADIGEERFPSSARPSAFEARATVKRSFAPMLSKRQSGGRYALYDNERTSVNPMGDLPFDHAAPPFTLRIKCRYVFSRDAESGMPLPPSTVKVSEECVERVFRPFGCTSVGMTHFPVCH